MSLEWEKTTRKLTESLEAAITVTASRLRMARAASYPNSREDLEKAYDSIWTLACRIKRALAYRGKRAKRMRQRLEEPKVFSQQILERATRGPLGEPEPRKPVKPEEPLKPNQPEEPRKPEPEDPRKPEPEEPRKPEQRRRKSKKEQFWEAVEAEKQAAHTVVTSLAEQLTSDR